MTVGQEDRPSAAFRAARPAWMAREILSGCLGTLQDVRVPALNVQQMTAHVAKATGALFAVQASEPDEPAHVVGVRKAMEQLRFCLEALQDADTDERAVHDTAAAIARVMAILYPVAKTQERASMIPGPPMPERAVPHDARRSTRRIAIEADIGFQSDTNFYTGFSEDISEGGLFIATYDFLPIGTKIAVNFTLPDGHFVGAAGVVRWVREYNPVTPDVLPGMGVQFADVRGEDRRAIDSFLQRRAPLFFDQA